MFVISARPRTTQHKATSVKNLHQVFPVYKAANSTGALIKTLLICIIVSKANVDRDPIVKTLLVNSIFPQAAKTINEGKKEAE